MKYLRLFSVFIVLTVFFLAITGCTPTAENTPTTSVGLDNKDEFLVYEDPVYKVRINYPESWELVPSEENIFIFRSPQEGDTDRFQENINLVMNDLSGQSLTLEAYKDMAVESLQQALPDFSLLELGSITLAGNPAYKVVFTSTVGGQALKFMQVFTMSNDISYVLTFTAEESDFTNYLGTAQEMIDSFAITGDLRNDVENSEEINGEDTDNLAGNTFDEEQSKGGDQQPLLNKPVDTAFVGFWRVFSERIFYDIGGAGALGLPVTRNLELSSDGTWSFGDSTGPWEVTEITEEDWARWDIDPYGPTRKITLYNWNDGIGDGPVEESDEIVDFIWVVYHVEPPLVENAGTVWLKFGQS